MTTESVLINNDVYDFSGTRLDIFGKKITGYTQVDYDEAMTYGEGRGASQVPLGTSRGSYKAEPFKVTVHRSTGEEIRQHIAGQSRTGKSLGGVKGTIVLQYISDTLGVQTVTCTGCKVQKPGTGSSKEGADPDMEVWEFYVRLLDRNGITLYESDEPGA